MTFEKLEKNLMDVVLEEQAKLGFRREKIRLYYPLSTLNHLLGTQDTAEQMEVTLAGQPESMTIKLGKLAVSRKEDRFCLCIPEEGSAYVHEHFAEKGFIYELIRLIGQLHMDVITEGVETEEQVEALAQMGCQHFQGYYFCRPMPVDQFEKKYRI